MAIQVSGGGGGGAAKSMGSSGMMSGGGGANIPAMIRENRQFRVTSVSIQERLTADFERAEEHAQSFESIRPIYEFNANWDYDEYRAQPHDISELKQMLELISNWNKELEKLRNKPIGVLEVDSKRLKNELVPLRESRLQEIKEYIKDLAKERCKTLLEHYKDCISKLSQKPQHLKDFAAHLNTVSSLREEEKALYKSTSQVDRMYNLLKLYEVRVLSFQYKYCYPIPTLTLTVPSAHYTIYPCPNLPQPYPFPNSDPILSPS